MMTYLVVYALIGFIVALLYGERFYEVTNPNARGFHALYLLIVGLGTFLWLPVGVFLLYKKVTN